MVKHTLKILLFEHRKIFSCSVSDHFGMLCMKELLYWRKYFLKIFQYCFIENDIQLSGVRKFSP